MHELNSCSGSRVGCEKAVATAESARRGGLASRRELPWSPKKLRLPSRPGSRHL